MALLAAVARRHPLRVTGTPLPPNLLLLCKLLAVAIFATGHYRILPEPFLPFIPGLDALLPPDVFRLGLQSLAVAAIALLFNVAVRPSAFLLGAVMLLAVVSSRAYYGNNKTFVGLCLVLAALSDTDRPPYLLRWQLALVYFGAALNKLLDPDWQSGLFFDYWAGQRLQNPVYRWAADLLPPLVAGKVMCWGTIAAELFASLGLLVPRLVPLALWANILFQVGLLEFTGTTFTLFFYAMNAATLAFVTWPEWIAVSYDDRRQFHRVLRFALRLLDPDGLQTWQPQPGDGIRVSVGGWQYAGFGAVQRLVLYSPPFWLIATAVLALADSALTRRLLVGAVLLLCLPVWGWMWRRRVV